MNCQHYVRYRYVESKVSKHLKCASFGDVRAGKAAQDGWQNLATAATFTQTVFCCTQQLSNVHTQMYILM